jgi:hypothetical protein
MVANTSKNYGIAQIENTVIPMMHAVYGQSQVTIDVGVGRS